MTCTHHVSLPPTPSAFSSLSLHDALPICPPPTRRTGRGRRPRDLHRPGDRRRGGRRRWRTVSIVNTPENTRRPEDLPDPEDRSEEHTSELQSRGHLVCRLLLEKKKKYMKG